MAGPASGGHAGVLHGASVRLETPEGIDLELRPAGPVPRGLALAIDETIAQIGSSLVLIALAVLGEAGFGLSLVVFFLVEWFYPVLFEVLRGGQTPGKRMMGLRVVNVDATPIEWNASLLRNVLRVADFLPGFYLAGLCSICITGRFQRLGDLAAGTLVVHDEQPIVDRDAVRSDPLATLGAARAAMTLRSDEQRALLAFAERQEQLSDARSIELADLLQGLSGAPGEAGRRELLRIANGIAGEG